MKQKLCKHCCKDWKSYRLTKQQIKEIRHAVKNSSAKWKDYYPDWLYHYEQTKLCKKHAARNNFRSSRRRARQLQATPKWADQQKIKTVYEQAKDLEHKTGKKMHVDHIVPLQGRTVSGLHVEDNLQILEAKENIRKSNKLTQSV